MKTRQQEIEEIESDPDAPDWMRSAMRCAVEGFSKESCVGMLMHNYPGLFDESNVDAYVNQAYGLVLSSRAIDATTEERTP